MGNAVIQFNSQTKFFTFGETEQDKLTLQCGKLFGPITVAYETYGELNENRSNAVLLFHALSGSQHAAGFNSKNDAAGSLWTESCHNGWWDEFVGPGRAVDTDKYFVISANCLGGCYGTTGPRSLNPETGKPFGSKFPKISSNDIVDTNIRLLDHLGISQLEAVIGGSLGGFHALNFAVRFSEKTRKVISLASGMRVPILQRIQNFEQVIALESDPLFLGGDYYESEPPNTGLALARMLAHKNYVSLDLIANRARKEKIDSRSQDSSSYSYQLSHQVESYMLHQGKKFVHRFDANSYLRLMDVWQSFDLLTDTGLSTFEEVFSRCRKNFFLVFSIECDVCFWPEQQAELVDWVKKTGGFCQYLTVHSDKGHDAFLIDPDLFAAHLRYFLEKDFIS